MPLVTLTVLRPKTTTFKDTVLRAVQEALGSIGVPESLPTSAWSIGTEHWNTSNDLCMAPSSVRCFLRGLYGLPERA